VLCGIALLGLAAGGCQSTQEKSRELAQEGKDVFKERGLRVAKRNPKVKVVETAVLSDANGAAAVVVLENRAKAEQAGVPVAIDVRGRRGKSVFRNDAPGLEPSLVSIPLLGGRRIAWVNDQVVPTAKPKRLRAKIGMPRRKAPEAIPVLRVQGVKLERLEATGLAASGFVKNESKVDQRDLVLYGVAQRGDRIVAAGRAQIRRLRAGKRGRFRMFFIGDPRGADLDLSVPPTRF
jgi:hypothetical protein